MRWQPLRIAKQFKLDNDEEEGDIALLVPGHGTNSCIDYRVKNPFGRSSFVTTTFTF